MKYKIIADSSCDLTLSDFKHSGIDFALAPLTITVSGHDYVDTQALDVDAMLGALKQTKEKSFSSCPSTDFYLQQMSGADKYFVVTLSSKLSGSYNAAFAARTMHASPDDIFIIDSKSVSGCMAVIIEQLANMINNGIAYEQICSDIETYVNNHTHLLFVINKFDNLVANGRVSKLKATIASTLNIKILCESEQGEIKMGKKVLGYHNALKTLVDAIGQKATNFSGKRCVVTHCKAEKDATEVVKAIQSKYNFESVQLLAMKGLCSYYALEGGVIVSFDY